MKLKRIIAALICGSISMGMLSGCGEEVDRDQYIARTRDEANAESAAEAAENNSKAAEERNLTPANWADMKFSIDGTELTLDKLPYSTFVSMGWSYDPSIYGLDTISFETNVIYDRSIYLNHASYDSTVLKVGFTNFADTPCSYDANHVWSVEFSNIGAAKYPEVKLGDITWGSDEVDVKAVFGEPTSTSEAEDGALELAYADGGLNVIRFYIYDGTGVGKIVMESFD